MSNFVSVRNFICSFLLLCLPFTFSFSQEPGEQENDKSKPVSLEKGSWSLQFRISDYFTLKAFQGSSISAKRHFSSKSAVRFGVSLNSDISETNSITFAEDNNQDANTEKDSNLHSFGTSLQYIYYPSLNSDANLYLGSGPFVNFNHSNFSRTDVKKGVDTPETHIITNGNNNSWDFGMNNVLGVEYFVSKKLSFLAEYNVLIGYHWSETSGKQTEITENISGNVIHRNEGKNKGFTLNSYAVKFGLSVYF